MKVKFWVMSSRFPKKEMVVEYNDNLKIYYEDFWEEESEHYAEEMYGFQWHYTDAIIKYGYEILTNEESMP